jgi:hypothetical protein
MLTGLFASYSVHHHVMGSDDYIILTRVWCGIDPWSACRGWECGTRGVAVGIRRGEMVRIQEERCGIRVSNGS